MKNITLTVREIQDLAMFAGIKIDCSQPSEHDDDEATITIGPCPAKGIHDEDASKARHYKAIAWFEEYPEEGCHGLGPEIEPIPENGIGKCASCGGPVKEYRCSACGYLGNPNTD